MSIKSQLCRNFFHLHLLWIVFVIILVVVAFSDLFSLNKSPELFWCAILVGGISVVALVMLSLYPAPLLSVLELKTHF
jgi:hypothetical protein